MSGAEIVALIVALVAVIGGIAGLLREIRSLRAPLIEQLQEIHEAVNSSRTALVDAHKEAVDELQRRLDEQQNNAIARLREELTATLDALRKVGVRAARSACARNNPKNVRKMRIMPAPASGSRRVDRTMGGVLGNVKGAIR